MTWEELSICFSHNFNFVDADPVIHSALQRILDILLKVVLVAYLMDPHEAPIMQSMMECYNVMRGPKDEDEWRNINIPETKGNRYITALERPANKINHPLNI